MSLADPSAPDKGAQGPGVHPAAPRPTARRRRRRRLAPWAVIGFGVLCLLAGASIATWAPALLPKRPVPALAEVTPPDPAPAPAVVAATPPLPPPPAVDGSEGLSSLAGRLGDLEAEQARTRRAAAAALAAAALVEASQDARPFDGELTALLAAAPGLGDLAALRPLAQAGAPTQGSLAASFPDFAARAVIAARAPGDRAGLMQRIGYALSRVIILRRVGEAAGSGPDAVLARAERQVEDGDLDAALKTLAALPPAAREALAPWTARAERRAEIDRRVAALRAQALADLALNAGDAG